MVKETELYDLVGTAPDATSHEIRRAYRRTALKCHPDRGGDTEEFQRLQEAYATLFDAEKRRVYDEFGKAGLEDDGFDLSGANFSASVTKEDIEAYLKKYRFSDMENEDLVELFGKLGGKVAKVLSYIPYSDNSDLQRFLVVFDECAEDCDDDGVKEQYGKAKKTLRKKMKGVKPRVEGDFEMENGKDLNDEEGDTVEDEESEGDTKEVEVDEGDTKNEVEEEVAPKKKGRKSKKSKKDDGMAALMEMFNKTKAEREKSFNSMVSDLEEKALAEEQRKELKRQQRSGKKKGTSSKKVGVAKKNGKPSNGRIKKPRTN